MYECNDWGFCTHLTPAVLTIAIESFLKITQLITRGIAIELIGALARALVDRAKRSVFRTFTDIERCVPGRHTTWYSGEIRVSRLSYARGGNHVVNCAEIVWMQ